MYMLILKKNRILVGFFIMTMFTTSCVLLNVNELKLDNCSEAHNEVNDVDYNSVLPFYLNKKEENIELRHRYITPATSEEKYKIYKKNWDNTIYKSGAKLLKKINCSAMSSKYSIIEVALNSSGKIVSYKILRPTGNVDVDNIIFSVVAHAAPFSELSKDILLQTDILHITTTIKFISSSSNPDKIHLVIT